MVMSVCPFSPLFSNILWAIELCSDVSQIKFIFPGISSIFEWVMPHFGVLCTICGTLVYKLLTPINHLNTIHQLHSLANWTMLKYFVMALADSVATQAVTGCKLESQLWRLTKVSVTCVFCSNIGCQSRDCELESQLCQHSFWHLTKVSDMRLL